MNNIFQFKVTPQNFGTANAGVYKEDPGAVFSIYAKNINASIRYFLILDQATNPLNGDPALYAFAIPPSGILFADTALLGPQGLACPNGIAWAFSSTEESVTLAPASDLSSFVGIL